MCFLNLSPEGKAQMLEFIEFLIQEEINTMPICPDCTAAPAGGSTPCPTCGGTGIVEAKYEAERLQNH